MTKTSASDHHADEKTEIALSVSKAQSSVVSDNLFPHLSAAAERKHTSDMGTQPSTVPTSSSSFASKPSERITLDAVFHEVQIRLKDKTTYIPYENTMFFRRFGEVKVYATMISTFDKVVSDIVNIYLTRHVGSMGARPGIPLYYTFQTDSESETEYYIALYDGYRPQTAQEGNFDSETCIQNVFRNLGNSFHQIKTAKSEINPKGSGGSFFVLDHESALNDRIALHIADAIRTNLSAHEGDLFLYFTGFFESVNGRAADFEWVCY